MQSAFNSSYRTYLASREWGLKKRAVHARSGGKCERCHAPATQVHHLTYDRLYRERISDLLDVCEPCHAYLSGDSDFDPKPPVMNEREWAAFLASPERRLFEKHLGEQP